jgi:hypothetical protein
VIREERQDSYMVFITQTDIFDYGLPIYTINRHFEEIDDKFDDGKTFTMANVIQALNKPTLVIAHNKTLAAQLYGEFKEFFPENAGEYFVSY